MAEFEQQLFYLNQALKLALSGKGECAPNPAVGAIVVKNQEVIAEGYHEKYGQLHAERVALSQLSKQQAAGASIYVTLEPCTHWGKTPPCTDIIIEKGIQAVYYAYRDNNPDLVSRSSQQVLQEHNITCQHIPVKAIDDFYQSYQYWSNHKKPWVTLKLAMSLDGKIATDNSQAVAITGQEINRFTHRQRYLADAILTTAKTVNNDDPQLNARLDGDITKKRLYILDSHLNINRQAQVFATAASITLLHSKTVNKATLADLSANGIHCVALDSNPKGIDLQQAITYIGQEGVHDLWVEAGGQCAQSLLEAGLVNRCLFYVAPKWLGSNYQSAFTDNKLAVFSQAKCYNWQPFGNDVLCEILLKE